jgi:hypothetical protein
LLKVIWDDAAGLAGRGLADAADGVQPARDRRPLLRLEDRVGLGQRVPLVQPDGAHRQTLGAVGVTFVVVEDLPTAVVMTTLCRTGVPDGSLVVAEEERDLYVVAYRRCGEAIKESRLADAECCLSRRAASEL